VRAPYTEQDVLGEDELARLLVYLLARESQPPWEPGGGRCGEGGHVDGVVTVPGGVEDLAAICLGFYGTEAGVQRDLAE